MSNRTYIMSHRGSFTSMVGWTPATPTQMNPIYELSINRQTFFGPNNQNSYQDKSHYHKKILNHLSLSSLSEFQKAYRCLKPRCPTGNNWSVGHALWDSVHDHGRNYKAHVVWEAGIVLITLEVMHDSGNYSNSCILFFKSCFHLVYFLAHY